MSVFANETEMQGMRLYERVIETTADYSGDASFGRPVPFYRQAAAYQSLKDMGVSDTAKARSVVARMADKVARDEPHAAMEIAYEILDVTGVYRVLAVLCTAERPQ